MSEPRIISRQAARRGVVLQPTHPAADKLAGWADNASYAQTAANAAASAGRSSPIVSIEMLKIYLVEDSPVIRENLAETLGELADAAVVGYADSEEDAKAWLATHPDSWHLAIVDLFLKRGNGLPVLKAVAARPPSQKVVVLSNYASPEIRAECMRLGADAVFDKSTDVDELIEFCLRMQDGVKAADAADAADNGANGGSQQ